jgi:hypothetical protein
MTRAITTGDDAACVSEASGPAQRVTLRIPTHLAAPSYALILREGPQLTPPRGRTPRVARLLSRRARRVPRSERVVGPSTPSLCTKKGGRAPSIVTACIRGHLVAVWTALRSALLPIWPGCAVDNDIVNDIRPPSTSCARANDI